MECLDKTAQPVFGVIKHFDLHTREPPTAHDRVLRAPGEPMDEAEYHRYFFDSLMFSVLGAKERDSLEWLEWFMISNQGSRSKLEIRLVPGII
jgi:hypothetical protein